MDHILDGDCLLHVASINWGVVTTMADEKIEMCCDTPLIPTFTFSHNEWFCRTCRAAYPFMNVPWVADATEELKVEKQTNIEWFREMAKECIPRGCRFANCERCKATGEDHEQHATLAEQSASRTAYARLLETAPPTARGGDPERTTHNAPRTTHPAPPQQ